MAGKKYNSVETTQSDIIKNQNLILEILTKIDQAVNSSDSFVTVNSTDMNGNEITAQVPSISYLNSRIDQLSSMVRKLSGFDGYPSTMLFDSNGKKIYAIDVNEEPQKLSNFNVVSTFKATPNWIFDSMMNPQISVELNLVDKISNNVKTIISKRFIVEFETMEIVDNDGFRSEVLTQDGRLRLAEFNELYNGKNDININDFVSWLDRIGVRNRTNEFLIDDDHFIIEPLNINYKGFFTIFGTEIDVANNKLWYIFDTLTYSDLTNGFGNESKIDLKPGVELAVNNPNGTSATVYKVAEISTITSQYRVRLEKVFGEEPVPVMQNGLRIHSKAINDKKVRISVGYDEYSVLFVKPLNDESHIQAVEWSSGLGFYTNELRLNDASGELLSDFYSNKVLDYGLILEELTEKKIPTYYGIKPDAPLLIPENFTIVQTNQHLTNTVDAERIRDLHNNKTNLTSEIQQIQNKIEKQNAMITKTNFSTEAEKKSAQEIVTKLNTDLINKTTSKNTITTEILQNKKNINKIKPTYSLRGIFPFPKAKTGENTKPQEVVQFEIWYRKLSKSGDENQLQTFKDISKQIQSNVTKTNLTAADKAQINNTKNVNATFSNWTKYKTDARKQVFNPDTGKYEWEIEDISDANTPTINQIDIPVEVGETIEIKVRSLSEVGYPEAPLESDFSVTITIPFPENLESILNDDDFILKDATADNIKSEMMKELETMGVPLHLSSQVRDVDVYYAHTSNAIASGFKDTNGRIINLYDYLLSLRNELISLKEEVNRSKGILEIYILYKNTKQRIFNTNNQTFTVQLEDYMTQTQIGVDTNPVNSIARTYANQVIKIEDYTLQIKNAAESALLGLLANRGYGSPAGFYQSTFAYENNTTIQPIYVDYTDLPLTDALNYSALPITNTPSNYNNQPLLPTQLDNSFIWQQHTGMDGVALCGDAGSISAGNTTPANYVLYFERAATNVTLSTMALPVVVSKKQNIGLKGFVNPTTPILNIGNISHDYNFTFPVRPANALTPSANKSMGTTVHNSIQQLSDLKNETQEKIQYIPGGDDGIINIPIVIYAKPFTGSKNYNDGSVFTEFDLPSNLTTPPTINMTPGNNITIVSTALAGKLNVGSKIILNSVATNDPIFNAQVNNTPLVISNINVGTSTITLNKNVASSVATGTTTGAVIQVHICNNNTDTNNGGNGSATNALKCFNVYSDTAINSVVASYIEIPSASIPVEHIKSLRYYLEDENQIRPIDFQLNFKIIQHKRSSFTVGTVASGTITPSIATE